MINIIQERKNSKMQDFGKKPDFGFWEDHSNPNTKSQTPGPTILYKEPYD